MRTIALILIVAGCGDSAKTCSNPAHYTPDISAARFPNPTQIDNAFFPLKPGTIFTYRDIDNHVIEVSVLTETKVVMGVTCVVIHDTDHTATGELVEDTYDWYAQDRDGNVWYLGEDTKLYQAGGVVSTQGSWEGGKDCAQPGIIMEAHPTIGDTYRQEYRPGIAEDKADVLSLTEHVSVPYGNFDNCLMTKDYTDLDPSNIEHKYFCPGVGQVSAVDIVMVGMGNHEDLVTKTGP